MYLIWDGRQRKFLKIRILIDVDSRRAQKRIVALGNQHGQLPIDEPRRFARVAWTV
jgi:hypothetical protein